MCRAVLTGVELLFTGDSESKCQDGEASTSPNPPPSSESPSPGLRESRPSFKRAHTQRRYIKNATQNGNRERTERVKTELYLSSRGGFTELALKQRNVLLSFLDVLQ